MRALRFSSLSTASRTKSVLVSLSSSAASMRARVPSANLACMSSYHIFLRPMSFFLI